MKSIMYVGATLMIGASIYGFVDYKKTNRNKELNSMYSEKKITDPSPVASKKTVIPDTKLEEKKSTGVKTTVTKNNKKAATVKKTRKFNTKLFSRGALDERYIEPEKEEKKLDD